MANIFWVKDGTVHTPTLSTGALAGVTRACVIELASKHFIPLVEGTYEMQDLTEADEIFLTSASLGLAIVTTFDFRTYSVPAGSVAVTLREAFRELTRQG
jgi:4-amino-4-deoxychorismate lyase